MSQTKTILKQIPELYRAQAFDLLLFGWVQCGKKVLPATSVKQLIILFINHYDIDEGEASLESLEQVYNRMLRKSLHIEKK